MTKQTQPLYHIFGVNKSLLLLLLMISVAFMRHVENKRKQATLIVDVHTAWNIHQNTERLAT